MVAPVAPVTEATSPRFVTNRATPALALPRNKVDKTSSGEKMKYFFQQHNCMSFFFDLLLLLLLLDCDESVDKNSCIRLTNEIRVINIINGKEERTSAVMAIRATMTNTDELG